jgi:hypothetical protein
MYNVYRTRQGEDDELLFEVETEDMAKERVDHVNAVLVRNNIPPNVSSAYYV